MEKERIIKTDLPAFQSRGDGGLVMHPHVPPIQRKRSDAEIQANWFGKERMKEAPAKEGQLPVVSSINQRW
jgi:hypothetical protein